jgi:hypothetical protein
MGPAGAADPVRHLNVSSQEALLAKMAAKGAMRVSVRSICMHDGALLVQTREYGEETDRQVVRAQYLFVVENRVRTAAGILHSLEHYFLVELDSYEIRSRESHLVQSWLPLSQLSAYDVRPRVVRDAIIDGSWKTHKHLIVPFA